MHAARLLALGWVLHMKMPMRSAFDGFLGVLWPLFFATVAQVEVLSRRRATLERA